MQYDVNNPPAWLSEIYEKHLGRKPDVTGMYYWIGVHDGGQTVEAIEKGISESEEALFRK